jgi:hypothetical protein
MQNELAEIYANIRDKALEEAAVECERQADLCQPDSPAEHNSWPFALQQCARKVRALKSKP